MIWRGPLALLLLTFAGLARADGPQDNLPDRVRPIPPKGITLADSDRAELQASVDELGQAIESVRETLKDKPDLRAAAGCADLS
jgi:hypothetical protein